MMIYDILNGPSIRRVLLVAFWMVRGSNSLLELDTDHLAGDIVLDIYLTSNLSYGELWKIRWVD